MWDGPDPDLQALADWLDTKGLTGFAETIRDWHPDRDGSWRDFARCLAELTDTPLLDQQIGKCFRRFLRAPKSRLRETIQLHHDH